MLSILPILTSTGSLEGTEKCHFSIRVGEFVTSFLFRNSRHHRMDFRQSGFCFIIYDFFRLSSWWGESDFACTCVSSFRTVHSKQGIGATCWGIVSRKTQGQPMENDLPDVLSGCVQFPMQLAVPSPIRISGSWPAGFYGVDFLEGA